MVDVKDLTGPALDAACAVEVMGWELSGAGAWWNDAKTGLHMRLLKSWSPSTTPAACEQVKAKLLGMDWIDWILILWQPEYDPPWTVALMHDIGKVGEEGYTNCNRSGGGDTECEAVCRAALMVVRA